MFRFMVRFMYQAVLVLQIVVSLLICLLVVISKSKSSGVKDFTSDNYSVDSVFAPKYANTLITRALAILGGLFFICSMSLMVIEKSESSKLAAEISGTRIVHSGVSDADK